MRRSPAWRQLRRCVCVEPRRVGRRRTLRDRLTGRTPRSERGSHVGCIAGALSVSEYRDGLAAAGLVDIEVELTHSVADGMHGAIVRAHKPS